VVEEGAAGGRHARVDEVVHDPVVEDVAAGYPGRLVKQPGPDRRVERVEEVVVADVHDPRQEREVGVVADHRGDLEQVPDRAPEPGQPLADDQADGGRDVVQRGAGHCPGDRIGGERAGLGQVPQQLADEERVATRASVDDAGQRRRRRAGRQAGERLGDGRDLTRVEAAERQVLGPGRPQQVGQHARQVATGRFLVPGGEHDEQGRGTGGGGEVA